MTMMRKGGFIETQVPLEQAGVSHETSQLDNYSGLISIRSLHGNIPPDECSAVHYYQFCEYDCQVCSILLCGMLYCMHKNKLASLGLR